jgi:hypothetical protein
LSEALQRNAKREARLSNIQLLQLIAAAGWLAKWRRLACDVTRIGRSSWIVRFAQNDHRLWSLLQTGAA